MMKALASLMSVALHLNTAHQPRRSALPPHQHCRCSGRIIASNAGTRLAVVREDHNAMHTYLTRCGFRCDSYSDGRDALRSMLLTAPPDLIVTDVLTHSIDGLSLLMRVRAEPTLCAVPVVMLANKGMPVDRIAGYKAGASAYLAEPFDPAELVAVINGQLSNSLLQRYSVVQSELSTLKQDVASVKSLLQMLLQGQAQAQTRRAIEPESSRLAPTPPAQLAQSLGALQQQGSAQLVLAAREEPPTARLPKLTRRERTVLDLVGEGKLNKEIAAELGVSRSHIEKYVKRLFDKTGTSNRTELVRRALQMGLLCDHGTHLQGDPSRQRMLLQPGGAAAAAPSSASLAPWPQPPSGVGNASELKS